MLIDIRLAGIPAAVKVHSATYTAPNSKADSDWDFYGGWSLDYTICDSKGRPAPWLENKLSQKDFDQIEETIINSMTVEESY